MIMPERPITQVELLVHPDYHLIGEDYIEPSHADLRKKWDARIAQTWGKWTNIGFLFSWYSFIRKNPREKNKNFTGLDL